MARSRSKKPIKKKPARRIRRRTRRRTSFAGWSETSLAAHAHDMRTALTGILALGELLSASDLGDRERRWASSIKGSAEHLAALTTLMIDAATADAGVLRLQQEPFRPRRLIEGLVDSLSARAAAKGLTSEATIADHVPDRLVGDAVRLRAALENLIDNAVKFTERGGMRLDVRAGRAPRGRTKLIVTVTDSGIGLKPAEIKRLFRPFGQASAEIARRYGGAGLGLAVVKYLATLMGGDLTVVSVHGRGSSFRFSAVLPIAAAAEMAANAPTRRLTVLCAAENPFGRVILNTILTELGHRADFVGSGAAAVAAAERGYDVALIDVALPDIGGLEATRRIRALPGAAGSTPIIGIAGRSEPGDEAAARAAGMNAYLRKPLSSSALAAALAAVIRPRPSRPPRSAPGRS